MISLRVSAVVGVLFCLPLIAQSRKFEQPWTDPRIAIVIDPYDQNGVDWSRLSADSRVIGIIHRATSGKRCDTRYQERKVIALARGCAFHEPSEGAHWPIPCLVWKPGSRKRDLQKIWQEWRVLQNNPLVCKV